MEYADGLTTERLVTRGLVYEDHAIWAGFFADEHTARFIPDLGETDHSKRAVVWINKQLNRYANNQYGLHMLLHKTTGEFIGQCGLVTQQIDGVAELEIGYHILPAFRGLGYATEAARKFKEYAFENYLAPSLISIIHKDNIASQKVAVKNGMVKERETNFNNNQVFIFRITFNEYKRQE